MNVADILKGAFRVYRRYPGTLFLVAAPVMLPAVTGILMGSLFEGPWVVAVVVVTVASWIFYVASPAAVVRAVGDALAGTAPDFRRSYAAVMSRLGRLVLAALRFGITFLVLIITIVGAPLAFDLLIRWFFLPQAIILEDTRAGEAFKRSGEVVAGSWWRVAGIVLLVMIMSGAPTFFVSLALFEPAGGFGLGLLSAPPAVRAVATSIIGTAMLPFAIGAETILFFDLKERKRRASLTSA